MSRISIDTLKVATLKIQAMDFRQKELLLDEIYQNQPHMLGLVLVQQKLGVSLEKIDFLLNILLNCFQAMKDSGLKWSKITEDEIDQQMNRFVATVNFAHDLGNSLQTSQFNSMPKDITKLLYWLMFKLKQRVG